MKRLRRSNEVKEQTEHIRLLKSMYTSYKALLVYAEGTGYYDDLIVLHDDIRYLIPTNQVDIRRMDNLIKNTIDDLGVTMYTQRMPHVIEDQIEKLKRLLKERNALS